MRPHLAWVGCLVVVGERYSLERDCCRGHVHLTVRELEILELVAAGCTNDQIGRLMYLSGPSVNRVVAQLLMRAQAKNRAELVARAFVEGVLDTLAWPPQLTGRDIVRLARERRNPVGGNQAGNGARAPTSAVDRHPQESCI
jgi:DNA-binding CsgD family transcriptional regulator